MIANARMYAVAPAAAAAWRRLLEWVIARAGLDWPVIEHRYPAPIGDLWARDDLGCVLMCGLPFARRRPQPMLLAAPVPSPARYGGRPVYFTDLVVHRDAPFRHIEDTFGHRLAWTVEDSQSGYHALRHHLLSYRSLDRPRLYRETIGNLVTPRRVVEAVAAGDADVGPVDSYALDLLCRHEPGLTAQIRVIASTAATPIAPFVAGSDLDPETAARLRDALTAAGNVDALSDARADLLLAGFAAVDARDYSVLLRRSAEADAAGYVRLA